MKQQEYIDIDIKDLKEFNKNPRKISKKELEKLKRSLDTFGYVEPVIIDELNILIGGHQRVKALKELKYKEPLKAIRITGYTEEEKKALNIALNKISGEWDMELLEEMLKDLKELDFDLDLTGFDDEDFKELNLKFEEEKTEEELNEVPEVSREAVSELGDLFLIDGRHRVLCGDSTDSATVERLMGGEKSELLFTSPPYSDMREYRGGKDLSIDSLINFISCFCSFCEYQVVNLGIKRKDGEVVEYWQDYIKKAKESGYKFLSWNIWNREGMGGSIGNMTAMFPIEHEWLFVFGKNFLDINKTKKNKHSLVFCENTARQKNGNTEKRQARINKYGKISSIISIDFQRGKNEHPAMFPVALPEEYIKAMTDINNIVSEPFLGSGTTLIACEETKRICYGIELDPYYIDVILRRYNKLYPDKEIKCLNREYDFDKLFKEE